MQISFAVTAKLISAFVFATWIVQSFYYLNLKFQASSYLPWLYSPVCVGSGRKPQRQVFSRRGSYLHGNPKDRFSFMMIRTILSQCGSFCLRTAHALLGEQRHEKICLRGFPPGLTQTRLFCHRGWLEVRNGQFRK